jgi:serine/threonine protein kinase
MKHRNLVSYQDYLVAPTHCNIVFRLYGGGSIRQILDQFGKFDVSMIRTSLVKVLSGLQYLHSKEVTHGNLVCSNILPDSEGQMRISDFGDISSFFSSYGLTDLFHYDMKQSAQGVAGEHLSGGLL